MIYLIIFLNRTFRRLFHLCFIVSNRIIQTYSITYIGASWLSNFGDSSSQLGKSRSECSTMFEQDEKEDADYAIEKQERQENEYKDPSYEAEEDEWGPQGVEQGQGDKFNETYMIKRDERKMEEEDISEDNMYDENGFDPDGYKKERHTVVQERQKKKELEVFVGGLDRDTTEIDLREVFSEVGDVTEVRLLMNPMTNKNKGFAFIRFDTVEQVRRALSL